MMTKELNDDGHVGDLLSGYIDNELTQQEQQRVRLHCDSCPDCSRQMTELREMRVRIGAATLSNRDHDFWREDMDDMTVKATRGIGWLLLLGGAIIGAGVGVYEILSSPSSLSLLEKLVVGGVYGGLLLIFISVLRQRLVERKSDRYKDVEI
jgi:hypothetical protein